MKKILFILCTILFVNHAFSQWTTNGTNIYNSNTGSVGIGISTPATKLEVRGSVYANSENNGFIVDEGDHRRIGFMKYYGRDGGIWRVSTLNFEIGRVNVTALPGTPTIFTTDLIVNSSGNVGIGTAAPLAKLAVNGDILCKKIKVTLQNWPDYVFEENYQLMPLNKVEAFIKQYKHLPAVPSAKTVEGAGLDVGENQAVLLKKIEELTLYLIDQNKKLENQQQEIELLKRQLKAIAK